MIGVIVAVVVSVVGWCGACVACCFTGEGLCTLLGKIPWVCKVRLDFFGNHFTTFYDENFGRSIGNGMRASTMKLWKNTTIQVVYQ